MLVGSLSGHPISRLVAGPVAQLIAEQIPDAENLPRAGFQAAPAIRAPIASATGSLDGGVNYGSVVEAYGEF